MDSLRKTALIAGLLYVLTFVSIPTLVLYQEVKDPNYILSSGPDTSVVIGGFLEIIIALAGIGTAVVLYPVVKRQNEAAALGFVGVRVLEAATIFVGVASLLTIVILRQSGVGEEFVPIGQAFSALYYRMFLIGQSLLPAMSALLLGTLLFRSRLVPRVLPALGLIGAPILVVSVAGVALGFWAQLSDVQAIATIPIALWEFSLGIWLVFKGFNASPITAKSA